MHYSATGFATRCPAYSPSQPPLCDIVPSLRPVQHKDELPGFRICRRNVMHEVNKDEIIVAAEGCDMDDHHLCELGPVPRPVHQKDDTPGFATGRRKDLQEVNEEENALDDEGCDMDDDYFLALGFLRGHPQLKYVDPSARMPSAAVHDILKEVYQAHPSLCEKGIPVFLEVLIDSMSE